MCLNQPKKANSLFFNRENHPLSHRFTPTANDLPEMVDQTIRKLFPFSDTVPNYHYFIIFNPPENLLL